jgi:hypothetical protein
MNIVLTAGRNERGGGECKALKLIDGRPAIEHQLDVLEHAAIVCQTQHVARLRNYGRVITDDSFSGPGGAVYAALKERPPDDPVTIVYADTLFKCLPEGNAWCGVWHTTEHRSFDVVVDGVVIRKTPNGWGDFVCVGAYRFPDPWELMREVAWMSGRMRQFELGGVVNHCRLPMAPVPSWKDTGNLS